ncbi:MAG: tetratricopeptide repeat protein [Myxococcales bacterium FL481]|nr:MAG: tetratricopeptide repeat protein [Myxococcales bacterium FL481]
MARQLWGVKLDRSPDDVEVIEALAELAVGQHEFEQAASLHARVLNIAPFRVSSHIERADLLAHAGDVDGARRELAAALQRFPHVSRLREMGRGLGLSDDLWDQRVDAAPIIAEYRDGGADYEGAGEVLVLDRDVARVYENLGQRHIVHQVVHLLSKPALDSYGEVVPPDGAAVLTLHSIKPDGTVLEPELVPGKDGLSLRHLEIGDLVEFEYLVDVDPALGVPGYVDLSRFRFQSLEEPYHRSELVVTHPRSVALRVESRNGAPTPSVRDSAATRTLTFRADRMPRKVAEPHHRSLVDELPMVRLHTDLALKPWLDLLSEQLWRAQRANAELEAKVRDLIRGHDKPRDQLRVLWSWVMTNVEDGGDLARPATRTLAQRRGDRLMLLRAMLQVAGIRSQLWLIRDKFGPKPVGGSHPMPEAYDTPALAVWPDDDPEPVMVTTVVRKVPLGYLAPAHAGSDALQVWLAPGDQPSGRVDVPAASPRFADRRAYTLNLSVDERGVGVIGGRIELHGIEAIGWRQILDEVDADRIEEVFQQSELGRLLPGATLDLAQLEMEQVDDIDLPLVLNFEANASGVGVQQSGDLTIASMFVSMNQGQNYAGLPSRWSGLLVPYAPQLEARVEVELLGTRLISVPKPVRLESEYGSYERTIAGGGIGRARVVIQTRATLAEGVVEARAYPEFAAFTREIAEFERAVLRAH